MNTAIKNLESKFKALQPNSMIRISNENLYIVKLDDGSRSVMIWDDSGFKVFGFEYSHIMHDFRISVTKERSMIICTDRDKEEKRLFNEFINILKLKIENKTDSDNNFNTFIRCFNNGLNR